MPMPLVKVSYDFALQQVERGKQGGGAVSLVVVGHGAAASFLEWQARLGPIESLNLALLIDAKDDRLVRRIQVEPDHVGEFFQEPGVAREFESLAAMRLEIVTPQDVTYRRLTNALVGRQGSATPMRVPFRFRLQGCVDHRFDAIRAISWLAAAARRNLPQSLQAFSGKTIPPESNRLAIDVQSGCDLGICLAGTCGQHDPAPQSHLLRRPEGGEPALDLPLLR